MYHKVNVHKAYNLDNGMENSGFMKRYDLSQLSFCNQSGCLMIARILFIITLYSILMGYLYKAIKKLY